MSVRPAVQPQPSLAPSPQVFPRHRPAARRGVFAGRAAKPCARRALGPGARAAWTTAWTCAAGLFAHPAGALAQPVARAAGDRVPVEIEWSAPAECPDAASGLSRVVALLGHPPETAADRRLRAHVQITTAPRGARWQVSVEMTTAAGSAVRAFAGASCERMADAAALVLAIAIDPAAVSAHAEPAPAEIASLPAAAPRVTPPPPSRAPAPRAPIAAPLRAPTRVRAALRAEVLGDVGTLPGVGAGVAIALGLVVGVGRLEAVAAYLFARHAGLAAAPDAGADFELLEFGLRGALAFELGPFELGPCATLVSGVMRAAGRGLTNPSPTTVPWLAALGGLAVAWRPVERLAIRAGLEAGPSLLRSRFVVDGVGPLFEPFVVVGRGMLGVELRLP